jgi:putative intracellular protease/amidase
MKTKKIIIPLPSHDFDPTEVSVSWKIVRDAGHEVAFATVDGKRGYADPIMITGEGLDPWGWIPVIKKIKLLGLFLRADRFGRMAYQEIEQDSNFLNPKRYDELTVDQYDGMILPGGHAPLMKQYLEDQTLQRFVAEFFDTIDSSGNHKPVAAVCHGVLLAVRSISKKTNKSVLYGKKTTGLTWALERSAWLLTRYFARYWDSTYYRTYMESSEEPPGYWSVESEIKRGLEKEEDFLDVPKGIDLYRLKTSGMARDRFDDSRPAQVVRDGNYISARWPGDVHTFAKDFVDLLNRS